MWYLNIVKYLNDIQNVDAGRVFETPDLKTSVFSQIIEDEFQKGPGVNVGELINNLTAAFGVTVPNELKPILDNFQVLHSWVPTTIREK